MIFAYGTDFHLVDAAVSDAPVPPIVTEDDDQPFQLLLDLEETQNESSTDDAVHFSDKSHNNPMLKYLEGELDPPFQFVFDHDATGESSTDWNAPGAQFFFSTASPETINSMC